MVWPRDGNMAYHTGIARRTVGRLLPVETRRGNRPRGLCARLSRHVLAACACRGRHASCASRAIPTSRSPPALPAPRSTATPNWCTRPSASPRRCAASAPKGEGKFAPITWDEALDEITVALEGHHRASRARWRCSATAYSAHQGLMNRGLPNGLFHALGTSRLQAGTVCDTCCEAAWDVDGRPGRRRRSGIRGRSPTW